MASAQAQEFASFHGEDVSIVLTGSDSTDPSAYTLVCTYAVAPGGTPVVTVSSITVGGSGPYTLTIPLTRAQTGTTLTREEYYADVWRTDSGSSKRLAGWKHIFGTGERAAS